MYVSFVITGLTNQIGINKNHSQQRLSCDGWCIPPCLLSSKKVELNKENALHLFFPPATQNTIKPDQVASWTCASWIIWLCSWLIAGVGLYWMKFWSAVCSALIWLQWLQLKWILDGVASLPSGLCPAANALFWIVGPWKKQSLLRKSWTVGRLCYREARGRIATHATVNIFLPYILF